MEQQIIQGLWEEVARIHAAKLTGHRIEIRVLDLGKVATKRDTEAFQASMSRIAKLTKGAARISPEPLRAEDFYESAE